MGMKKIIIIYTFSPFPCGDANSNRLLGYALSMRDAGYRVIVLTNAIPRESDYINNRYEYKGIEYRSYYVNGLGKIRRVLHRNNIGAILDSLLTQVEQENVCAVCSSYRNYGFYLHLYLLFKRIPAIVDVTEWHSSFQFKYGILNPNYIWHSFKNRYLIPRAKNVLCISRYLETYYKKVGCNTQYLPPQIIIDDYLKHKIPKIPPVRFFYAGTMLKKDFITVALKGFGLLSEDEKQLIQCTIVGCDETAFRRQLTEGDQIINSLGDSLNIIGRISKQEVEKQLSKTHFMMLMRPKSRYSTAGFPSKVPESLAAGVPIISNLTSDLGNYIYDMENGLIVDDFTPEAFASAVRKAIGLTYEEFQLMSDNAYNTAKNEFNYKVYNESIAFFLSKILSSSREN